jgi:DNA-binding transcriptional MerR regulator
LPLVQRALGPSEVARLTGVSADTLRHYEKKGLLPTPARTASGYRRYAADTVTRVHLIQGALVIGFSLDELTRILRERDRGAAPCQEVRALVNQRLADLEDHIKELATLRTELQALVEDWDAKLARTTPRKRAHLLETLATRPAIERARRLDVAVRPRRGLPKRPGRS